MAFTRSSLARLGTANSDAGAMWIYSTADAMTVVRAADYFLEAIDELKVNDVIVAITATGGTPNIYFTYVNANDGSTIDVVDGLLIPTTDT